jgi:hypothetical protein
MTDMMREMRADAATITDDMRAVRRLYRVERSTGSVIRKSDGQIVGWVHTYNPGDGRVSSYRLASGGDFTDEWSVTHAVCLMHRSPADPAEVEKWLADQ